MEKIKTIAIAVLLAAIAFLLIRGCSRESALQTQLAKANKELVNVESLRDSVLYLNKERDSIIGKLYVADLRIIQADNTSKLFGDSLKRFKRLYFGVTAQLHYQGPDTVFAAYTDTVLTPGPCDTVKGYMKVPRGFAYNDSTIKFTGLATERGVKIYDPYVNLGIINATAGWVKERGKKPYPRLDITTNSGYVYITSIKNFVVQPEPVPWYNTRVAWFFYGAIAKSAVDVGVRQLIVK